MQLKQLRYSTTSRKFRPKKQPCSGEPHREGGGNEGAVVFYSVRAGAGEVLFEVLDDKLKVVGTLNMADFEGALEDQKKFRSQQA
jgi:hypothetical protein